MLRLYFYSNAIGEAVCRRRSITTDSPAGTRKVISICQALRAAGVRPTIVSMGRGRAGGGGAYHRVEVGRLGGIPIVYGPMSHRPLLSQLLTMIWLFAMAVRLSRRRRRARHLFYNQWSAYLPALFWLRLAGQPTLLDLEDGPIRGHKRPGRRFRNAPAWLYTMLISDGALVASTALAGSTRIQPTLACYGAIATADGAADAPPAVPPEGPLDIIYAGLLNDETGVALLVKAIEMMRAANDPAYAPMRITIAGMGPGVDAFSRFEEGRAPSVRGRGRLSGEDYAALLRSGGVGLSLRLIGGGYSETTFPSKVVEFAEHGVAIIATDTSDLRLLFGDTILYLERNAPEELVAQLGWALRNREALAGKAAAARRLVRNRLSLGAVGGALADFLFAPRSPSRSSPRAERSDPATRPGHS